MQTRIIASLCFGAFPCASSAIAGNVLVVGSDGSFATIQAAVDAASDFDTIVVRAQFDDYVGDVTVSGKSLAIVGDVLGPWSVDVQGQVQIDGVPAGGLVVVGQIDAATSTFGTYALRTANNAGSLRIESCSFFGKTNDPLSPGNASAAWIGIDADTQLVDASLYGGSGGLLGHGTAFGATAMFTRANMLKLFGGTLVGGTGSFTPEDDWNGGAGGAGLEVADGNVSAVGCTITGGQGGEGGFDKDDCPDSGGRGGDGGVGIVIGTPFPPSSATPYVRARGSNVSGGAGGAGGGSFCGPHGPPGADGAPTAVYNGTWTPLAGFGRWLGGAPAARDNGTPASLVAHGASGDRVYVRVEPIVPPFVPVVATAPGHTPISALPHRHGFFLGTIPASGVLEATLPVASLAPSVPSEWWRLRSVFVASNGTVSDGNDFVLVVINAP